MHEHTWQYIWLIPLFPMVGAVVNGLLGKRLPKPLVHWVACGSIFLSFLVSVGGFLTLRALPEGERVLTQTLFEWIVSGSAKIDLGGAAASSVQAASRRTSMSLPWYW